MKKPQLKLKERVFFDGYIHELFFDKKARRELGTNGTNIYLKRPNKHYKKVLVIES